jgi:polysaccharide deacetylase family protein (PEP-CTERM system associated)
MQNSPNFLTFDIEEWFHANYEGSSVSNYDTRSTSLESNVDKLIDMCAAQDVKSTCFVLGDVAKDKPNVVRKLFDAGHEIASHGSSHKLVYTMTPLEFRADLKNSTDTLEQITGQKVVGFRAPSWSVKADTVPWFYEILAQGEFTYSSSVYPARHTLFGIEDFKMSPHYPTQYSVLEIPQHLMSFLGSKIGYAGGGFLRFFPTWLIKQQIHKANANNESVFLYLHPREIEVNQPRLALGLVDGYFHYQGIKGCEEKFSRLIQEFKSTFVRMDEYALKSQSDLGFLPKKT